VNALHRRSFLKALTALPVFGSLRAAAQAAPKKRLLIFTTPNGTVMDELWPGVGSTTFKSILAPLQALQRKVSVVRGLDSKGAIEGGGLPGHIPDFPALLTGRAPAPASDYGAALMEGISIDQHIANAVGAATRFKSKELGVGGYSGGYNLLARAARQPLTPELSPYRAFTSLFSGVSTGPGVPDPAVVLLHQNRKSLFDLVRGELTQLRCALGTEDQLAFDAHTAALRDLEKELTDPPAAPENTCVAPTLGAAVDTGAQANYPKLARLQMDVAAAAFACDLTRVITLQFHTGASNCVHTWASSEVHGTHHGIGHNSEGVNASDADRRRWLISIENWFGQQFAYLVNKLESIPDGPGQTLLDNTAVVWAHEQTDGGSHQRTDMPFVIAGGCGGALQTGKNVQFSGGRAVNDLLITLANAMGVPTTTFGTPSYVTGPLTTLLK
jgi:hypothetical protein